MRIIQIVTKVAKCACRRLGSALLCVTLCLLPLSAVAIPGQPGTLDASWATLSPLGAGKVITPIGSGYDNAYAIALQPDGKIVLAGDCDNGSRDFCALRYNANGTLDTSFGTGGSGKVITPIGDSDERATAIALQPDGKIVLAGACYNGTNNDFCALRYNANGALDTSFGGTGKVITAVGGASATANAMALQPDGKIVLAGRCSNGTNADFCALRYNANGALDVSFGTGSNGKVITPIGGASDYANAIALQPDGKIVLAGQCDGTTTVFCALRYNTNGTLDTSFGTGGSGKVITPVGSAGDIAFAIALQPDGKIVLAGYCSNGADDDFCALRYNANGALDISFGTGGSGKVITPVGSSEDLANAIALQPDGKIVLAGFCYGGNNIDFCALRYDANGTLDVSFGTGGSGKVVTPVGSSDDQLSAMAVQPDGKIVLAGFCSIGINNDFCALRYDGGPFGYRNCTMDIDGDGRVTPTIDALIVARIGYGMTGASVIGGITFPANAARNTWPEIRDYLITQCGMSIP